MARRFFRLYPLHVVTTAGVLLAVLAVQSAKWLLASQGIHVGGEKPFAVPFFDLDYLGLELLLLQGVGLMTKQIHNYPSWSISVEVWMYLFFGVSMLLVRTRWLRVVFSMAIVALCLVHFISAWSSASAPVTLDVQGLARGLLSFFLGVLVFYAWTWWPGRSFVLPSLLQSAALLLALWLVGSQASLGAWQLAIPFSFAVLVFALLPDRGLVAAVLQSAPMQWLGVHSYAIYLTHVAVQTVLDWPGRVVPEPAKHLVGLAFIAGVLLMSVLAHRCVEVPWRERGKRVAARIEAGGSVNVKVLSAE